MKPIFYSHKSGKCVAEQIPCGTSHAYSVKDVTGQFSGSSILPKELIEDSNDWTKMISIDLTPLYNEKQIANAFRTFLAGIKVNGQPVSYPKKLRFEEIFFQLLLEQKK